MLAPKLVEGRLVLAAARSAAKRCHSYSTHSCHCSTTSTSTSTRVVQASLHLLHLHLIWPCAQAALPFHHFFGWTLA